jgi:NAD(P)-dependent dehydrogenase (short-subunit alcohol dehydrogenase family)
VVGYLEDQAGLTGKVAAVLGAAEGLGKGITLALAHCGVDLALCDREGDALRETAAESKGIGRRVLERVFDVEDDSAQVEFFRAIDEEFGHIDVLVNVVGGGRARAFLESGPEDWERDISWNYRYLVRSTYEGVRRMGTHGGSIINITTIEGHRAAPYLSVYAGAKAAVENFTRSVAVELAPLGIRANTIAPDKTPTPGVVRSGLYYPPIRRHPPDEVARMRYEIAIPMGRPGRLQDIANCALFLASDLSSYVTGQALHPDGGAWASSGWLNWPGIGFRPSAPSPIIEAVLDSPEDFPAHSPSGDSDPTWLSPVE